jgi:hypothetical protein
MQTAGRSASPSQSADYRTNPLQSAPVHPLPPQYLSRHTAPLTVENPPHTCYRCRVSIYPDDLPPQNRRRSKRVQVRIPVLVRLQDSKKNSVEEKTHTIIVNSHGALILLATKVNVQQIVRVENVNTKEELLCRVACLGSSFMGKTQVAIEFIMPAPKFWRDRPAAPATASVRVPAKR